MRRRSGLEHRWGHERKDLNFVLRRGVDGKNGFERNRRNWDLEDYEETAVKKKEEQRFPEKKRVI